MIRVKQMQSDSGNPIANQFIINDNGFLYFQSYDSIIARKWGSEIILDYNYWDYSRTTSKYLFKFLKEDRKTVRLRVRTGEYKMADLNQ
jgi:hypothetical protein